VLDGMSVEHGPGVRRRADLARRIAADSLESEDARARWRDAIAAIGDAERSPAYGGLELVPQIGLLPLGPDPRSGLWEFAHVQSGSVPVRDPVSGELVLAEDACVVLVLLPGGAAAFGSQKTAPRGLCFDPFRQSGEAEIRTVDLAPFFIAKHELTQAQWLCCTGANPAAVRVEFDPPGGPYTLRHPIETVSWNHCQRVLARYGLAFPTEAQWEHAARGGTTTPWWTGAQPESLQGAGNFADRFSLLNGGNADWPYAEWLDDGHVYHAPVGSYRPNPFGLHDVCGNVWEWCLEPAGEYDLEPARVTGEWLRPASGSRKLRGGSFRGIVDFARSSYTNSNRTDHERYDIGVRPARALER
jgi:formylglycine-generating enzyme required for sulfatase activity